ncbi:hypothetical protein Fmac_015293 [Flemingia macrophylla]|uniref:Uncharacterized protein n=1 Tax=Flemingia macrophylla TaxID=520843 RepID=A0ABD1ME58_9FABA
MKSKPVSLLQESAASVLPMTTTLVSVLLRSNLEWMSILRLMLQTPIADNHNSRDKALDREDGSQLLLRIEACLSLQELRGIRSSNDHHTSVSPSSQQLDCESKPASVARVCDIRSSNDHHTSVCPSSQQSRVDEYPEAYTKNTYSRDHHSSRDKALDRKDGSQLLASSVQEMMPLSLEEFMMWLRIHLAEVRKLEGKLDALVSLVTQLAANQKPASVARVCDIRSSNDHHTSVSPSSQQFGVDEHPEAYAANTYRVHDVATDTSAEARKLEGKLDASCVLRDSASYESKPASVARVCGIRSSNVHHTSRVYDVATDTSTKARKLEGKLDALVSLVTQLTTNQKPASVAIVCGIRSSNDHHTSVCPSSQQSGFSARNDAIVIRGVHDVATDTSTEASKLEGKLDALVNMLTLLAANQKSTSVARVCGIRSSKDHHTSVRPSSQQSGVDEHPKAYAANTGVHDVTTDTSLAEARKLEGKLDALVNMLTQLAANQKSTFVVRVCGIRSSNDHHTNICPSSQQSGVDEHLEAYAANIHIHDVAKDTYAEARKLEGKLDALVRFVTQLALNQKPASVARVCGIRSSNDHHTSVCPSSMQSGVDQHPEAYAANTYSRPPQHGVHDVTTDTSVEARKLEGKLDSLVSLVTQLAANQKPTSVARVCGIRSSNDRHTSVSYHHSSRDMALDREDGSQLLAVQSRKPEGKLDVLMSLVTQLGANQKPASNARVCDIRSSNDHHTSFGARNDVIVIREVHDVATDILATLVAATAMRIAFVAEFNARNDAIVIRGVHDMATDTSAEARKLEGKLDALVNLVTQLAANQEPTSVARVCGIRSSNDHHTSACPSS